MGSHSGYSKMKFQLFTLAVLVLVSAVVAHEEISCMACGEQTEGSESPYTGMCKNADDPGNTTKCNEEEFKSCMQLLALRAWLAKVSELLVSRPRRAIKCSSCPTNQKVVLGSDRRIQMQSITDPINT